VKEGTINTQGLFGKGTVDVGKSTLEWTGNGRCDDQSSIDNIDKFQFLTVSDREHQKSEDILSCQVSKDRASSRRDGND